MLEKIFGTNKPIIGVIHLLPLPGSPRWDGHLENIFLRAEQEAASYATGGAHGVMLENFFDAPFTKGRVDTAAVCAMTQAVKRVMAICDLPVGINVLRNDGLSAMAIASTTGAQFIRVNVFTSAMLTDQGIIEGIAHELLLYRKQLGASKTVKIFADVMVKHADPLSTNVSIEQLSKDAVYRGLADGIIISGFATGSGPDMNTVLSVRNAIPQVPLFIGSGTTKENIKEYFAIADGAIVASSLKRQGQVENPVDVERVRSFAAAASK